MTESKTPKEEKKKLEIVEVEVGTLKDSEYNPRSVTDEEFLNIKASVHKFGIVDPLIVNGAEQRKNIVIGGHLRLRVAKSLGIEKIPVVYVYIEDLKTEQELNLRLNNNTGHNDLDLLANLDDELLRLVGLDVELMFKLNEEIPTLEDVLFEDIYEPNWVVLRFDDSLRHKVIEALQPLRGVKGIKVEVAKEG